MANIFRGIAFPFRKGSLAFPKPAVDDELIKDSLLQILLTGRGERIMRPGFGSNVYSYLFENNDALLATLIQQEVAQTIAKFEPRVIVQGVDVTTDDPQNKTQPGTSVIVTVRYIVIPTQRTDQLQMNFSAGA